MFGVEAVSKLNNNAKIKITLNFHGSNGLILKVEILILRVCCIDNNKFQKVKKYLMSQRDASPHGKLFYTYFKILTTVP